MYGHTYIHTQFIDVLICAVTCICMCTENGHDKNQDKIIAITLHEKFVPWILQSNVQSTINSLIKVKYTTGQMGGGEGNIIMEYGIETFVYKEEKKYQIEAMPNTFGSTRWGIDRGRGKSNDVVLKEINCDMNK